MKHYVNHEIENRLYEEGFSLIAGTDEVGRGPLAGPVVAACCIMPKNCYIEGVTDSKKISEKNRKVLEGIIKEKAISYKVVFIDPKKIDEINIYEASRLAMTTAINELTVKPDYVLADAMPLFVDIPTFSAISSFVGTLPYSVVRSIVTFLILDKVSIICTGKRIILDLSAIERVIACCIHHVA